MASAVRRRGHPWAGSLPYLAVQHVHAVEDMPREPVSFTSKAGRGGMIGTTPRARFALLGKPAVAPSARRYFFKSKLTFLLAPGSISAVKPDCVGSAYVGGMATYAAGLPAIDCRRWSSAWSGWPFYIVERFWLGASLPGATVH
jgi:hypothetical protein